MEQSQHVLKRALQEADWIKDEYLKALALSDIAAVLVKVDVGRAGQVFQEALRVAAGIEVEFDIKQIRNSKRPWKQNCGDRRRSYNHIFRNP